MDVAVAEKMAQICFDVDNIDLSLKYVIHEVLRNKIKPDMMQKIWGVESYQEASEEIKSAINTELEKIESAQIELE